jgi:hypothetical protein
MFIDSCFSGLAFVDQATIDKQPDELYREVIERPTVQLMTAGLETERAYEDPNTGHGVFTDALLRQLRSSDIMTMEEVFFPLRVKVRHSLEDLNKPLSMSPQHRYLLYHNGTFLFVPLSQLSTWAQAKSDNPTANDLGSKGYYRPVTVNEVTNLQSAAAASPGDWDAQVDRYEARASMGDPYATVALGQIYSQGIGMKPNPQRAKLYTAESSDIFTAGKFNFAGMMGITNEVVGLIVNSLIQKNGGPAGTFRPGNDPVAVVVAAQQSANFVKPVWGKITGWFKHDPATILLNHQKKLTTYLAQQPTMTKNIISAKSELTAMLTDLDTLGKQWPETSQPPEVAQLKQLATAASASLDAGNTAEAKATIESAGPAIDSLVKIIQGASAGQ